MLSKTISGTYLPRDYAPSSTDILCGRGKGSMTHCGNKMMLAMIRSNLDNYSSAPTQKKKSVVVTSVINRLSWAGLRFLRYDNACHQYLELGPHHTHEKVGKAIRDLINQDKRKALATKRRREARKENKVRTKNDNKTQPPVYKKEDDSIPVSAPPPEKPVRCISSDSIPCGFKMEKSLFSVPKNTVSDEEFSLESVEAEINYYLDLSFDLDFSRDFTCKEENEKSSPVISADAVPCEMVNELTVSPLPLDSKTTFECQDIKMLWNALGVC